MIWIDTIEELDYYTEEPPCYCELLLQPQDLLLQGNLGVAMPPFDIQVTALTPDGLTVLGDVLPFISVYYGTAPNGTTYFNLRLNTWPQFLCKNPCFVLHVVIPGYFDKYTKQYCIHDCCVLPDDITVEVEGQGPFTFPTPPVNNGGTMCLHNIVTIKTVFDCWDEQTGDFYGEGESFPFYKITNIEATFKRLPREIQRTISQNCRLQKSASTRQYELQSFEQFPLWKADELESMFHANHIYINGVEYQMQTDTPFRSLFKCKEKFALKTAFEDCQHQQVFGCGENCEDHRYYFRIANDAGTYQDEIGRKYATPYELLRVQNGVQDVEDVTADVPFPSYKTFAVKSRKPVPAFYAGKRVPANKVYPHKLSATSPDYSKIYSNTGRTPAPVVGTITVTDYFTPAPVIGTITVTDEAVIIGQISPHGNWQTDADAPLVVRQNQWAALTLSIRDETRGVPSGSTAPHLAEPVAVISQDMAPRLERRIAIGDSMLFIQPNGTVYWYGVPTSATPGALFISISNITYQIL